MQYFNIGLQALPRALDTFELCLNITGYSPQLGRYSRDIRCVYGFIQVISAIACEIICGLGALMAHALGRTDLFNIHMFANMNVSRIFLFHGLSNILRAIFEREVGALMILYDLFFKRFRYEPIRIV